MDLPTDGAAASVASRHRQYGEWRDRPARTRKTAIEQFSRCEKALLSMFIHCEGVLQDVRAREQEWHTASGPQTTNLHTLVEESCVVLGAQAENKRLTVTAEIPPDIHVLVRPGPFVVHVLNNILRNAIKFSYPGGRIEVSAFVEGSTVAVVFRDFGCGIPGNRAGALFETPATTVGTAGEIGTGYGLLHVRECLQDVGGTINVASVHEEGSGGGEARSEEVGTTVTIRVLRATE